MRILVIIDIDKIWTTLISSFGNMTLLMQNKIGNNLEKQNGLWIVLGDEKIAIAIATLLNRISELGGFSGKI